MSEREELREPPSDQTWMETEQIGVGYGLVWVLIAAFALALTLAVVLPLVLS